MKEKVIAIPDSILKAENITYNNANSGLDANTVQAAIDEIFLAIIDTTIIEEEFRKVFMIESSTDPTAMTSNDVLKALETEWNGEESTDPTAMTSNDVLNSLETEWNGEESTDPEAMKTDDILESIT